MKKTNLSPDFGLERFREINRYTANLLKEQVEDAPAPPPGDPNAVPPPPAGELPPADPNAVPPPPGGEGELPPEGDTEEEIPPEVEPSTEDDSTEEIDITDLVNMVKDVKRKMDSTEGQDNSGVQKMDDIFSKLSELEGKLGEMDSVLAKIDQLGAQIQDVKPKTPIEKLEMRSLDSYPFNQKPDEFFSGKQDEMRKSGKNEYVLTKGDVEQYGKYDVMKSFNPAAENQY